MSPSKRRPFTPFGAAVRRLRKPLYSPADGSGITIRIRYRILNARLAAGAVSAQAERRGVRLTTDGG
jgi:hypothetical protein